MQLRLAGIPVRDDQARRIVTALVTDDTPQALNLANRITTGIELGFLNLTVDAQERSTLLAVLENPPDELSEFRNTLDRVHRDPT
jgi:hypothetical protein